VNRDKIIKAVFNAIETETGVTREQLISRSKVGKAVPEARNILFYILKTKTNFTFCEIAKTCNRANHTTAMYSRKRCQDLIDTDPRFREAVGRIEKMYENLTRELVTNETKN
jgi:chromosomal replication initiation ATPase DnaA